MNHITGLRVDFNSPINSDGEITDDSRIRSHAPTLEKIESDKIVIMTHQGRPGEDEFVHTKVHAEKLQSITGEEVDYVASTKPRVVKKRLKSSTSRLIMMQNTRMFKDEINNYTNYKKASECAMVSNLSEPIDQYINDAFSVSHRAHASIVGFPQVVESKYGPLFREEISNLNSLNQEDTTYCIGGAKLVDKISYVYELLRNKSAKSILLSGLVANIIISEFENFINKEYSMPNEVSDRIDIDELRSSIDDQLVLPSDLATLDDGRRVEFRTDEFPTNMEALDIGELTISDYTRRINNSSSVVCVGPAGMYEDKRFSKGTKRILQSVSNHGDAVLAGGDTISSSNSLGINGFSYVSNGGGATLAYLSRETLPAIESIES